MTLTKNDIIEQLQTELGLPRNRTVKIVEDLLDRMKSTLASGEDLLISGFGKFCVKTKNERKGRNPATGEDLTIEGRKIVTFKCSTKLKDRINGK